MELVILPLALVGHDPAWVIEHSIALHFVILPLSFVLAPLLVYELSLTIAHPVLFLALITCPRTKFLDDKALLLLGGYVRSVYRV